MVHEEDPRFGRWFLIGLGIVVLSCWMVALALSNGAGARDLDGRYAASPLHDWISSLHTPGGGLCCSMADGAGVEDINWDTADGHYRVRLEGEWVVIPDDKVVTEPNKLGRTMVWTYRMNGKLHVRCFMPGSMT